MSDVLLRAVRVRKTIGPACVLDDVSLEVRRGDIVGLIGANGAGKTTLIRILMGLLAADEGVIDGPAAPSARARVGYLPEERGLYQRHRVCDTLEYLALLKGLAPPAAASEARRCLERVEMAGFGSRRVKQMSKGQQQKVQLAAALVGDPELYLLDEPFAGLDPLNARLVCDVVREAAARRRGVLVSAHQLALVDRLCTHVVMLAHGRVAVAAPIQEIRATGGPLEEVFAEHAGGLP